MQFWAPDDGRKNRLKHVQCLTEINELWNVTYCRLYAAAMVTSIAVYVWPNWQLPSIKHLSDTCTQLNVDNPPVHWSRYSMSSGIVRMMPRVCRVTRDILCGQPQRMFLWIWVWGKVEQLKIENGMMVLFIITVVRATNRIIWNPFKYNKHFYFSAMHAYLNIES